VRRESSAGAAGAAGAPAGWSAKLLGLLTKPAVAVTAGATIAAGGVYVVTQTPNDPPPKALTPTASASASRPPSAAPTSASPSPSPSPSKTPTGLYGSVVDAVDRAPAPNTPPAALPHRPASGVTSTGGAHATMNHRGDNVTLSGQGYVLVRWQISPQYRSGALVMPSWTALKGKLFHVASGGGRRMDDPVSTTDTTATGMGNSTTGYDVLPTGTQQMWQNEYFYVDGSVTLTVNERGADYGLNVFPTTWDAVEKDITTGPTQGATRYGLTRDTGKDDTPIPQYVTRTTPTDPATVVQELPGVVVLRGHDLVTVLEGPGPERVDRVEQRPPQRGEFVLHTGRRTTVRPPRHEPVELQPPQGLRQHLLADPADPSAQLTRP
jgi:hypothetical protein